MALLRNTEDALRTISAAGMRDTTAVTNFSTIQVKCPRAPLLLSDCGRPHVNVESDCALLIMERSDRESHDLLSDGSDERLPSTACSSCKSRRFRNNAERPFVRQPLLQ